jgi:hypothetical protein
MYYPGGGIVKGTPKTPRTPFIYAEICYLKNAVNYRPAPASAARSGADKIIYYGFYDALVF